MQNRNRQSQEMMASTVLGNPLAKRSRDLLHGNIGATLDLVLSTSDARHVDFVAIHRRHNMEIVLGRTSKQPLSECLEMKLL